MTLMRDALAYGGPDDAGNFIEKKSHLALGHRRLSILDLSSLGHQPMESENGNLWISYNGEAYNFKEIRQELEQKGHRFKSHSDTEIILAAYQEWGFECLKRLRGMWAFAIWDKNKEELILCRDRIGVKPLYWYHKNGLFMFASELKSFHQHPSFHKKLDEFSLALYFQYGYISAPHSIFKHTYKLEPGHFLVINKNQQIKKIKYWDIKDCFSRGLKARKSEPHRDEEETARELEKSLTESFKLRIVSDVPVGVFLSGGIDSSLVAALLQKESSRPIKTFTIGFREKEFNEAQWAKKVARHLHTDHTELYCGAREAFEIIPKLSELYDEPFGDSSGIPTFLVSKLAREKVKVALSGDGGDEQFCGYNRYWLPFKLRKLKHLPSKTALSSIVNFIPPRTAYSLYQNFRFLLPAGINVRDPRYTYKKIFEMIKTSDIIRQYDISSRIFLSEELKSLGMNTAVSNLSGIGLDNELESLEKMMLVDLKTYLPDDLLVKVDRASMSVALEAREPFLDNKILEFSSALAPELKYKNGISKYILKKILYRYVPPELVNRPKQGFGVPLQEWFSRDLKQLYLESLSPDKIKQRGILNPHTVNTLLKEYLNCNTANSDKLWLIFAFQMWQGRWM